MNYLCRFILLFYFLVISTRLSSQSTSYYYQFKVKYVTTTESSIDPCKDFAPVFKSELTFIDSLDIFEVKSNFSLLENTFKYVVSDFGYELIFFRRQELVGLKHNGKTNSE